MSTLQGPIRDVGVSAPVDVTVRRWDWRTWGEHAGWIGALATFLLRLPGIGRAPSPDEAGFLVVARQWSAPGTSLYGDYWVDRPPLLITIFRFAALNGGLETLRVVGAVAAALTVWGVAHVAAAVSNRAAVPAAAPVTCAALAATAWLTSPLTGSAEVNGELLAAPFVVWGIAAAVSALLAAEPGAQHVGAAASGACAVAAVLVKQNFADVAVFAGLGLLVGTLRGEVGRAAALRLSTSFAGGGLAVLMAAAGWTVLHGTSIPGVVWAMYPFRVAAGQVIAASGNTAVPARLGQLGQAWLLSGLGVVTVGAALLLLRRASRISTVTWAVAGLVVFDVVSILLGGSYWLHYLVQLVVPLSILLAMSSTYVGATARRLVVPVVASAVIAGYATGGVSAASAGSEGAQVGRAVAAASRPGDTIVTLYGHSDVTQQSGLESPYPYLWSLPIKTLDPRLTELLRVLEGPTAPTWIVTWAHVRSWGVQSAAVSAVISRDYHVAAVIDGHTIYLRNAATRPAPVSPTTAS